jgi:hypothetical protein
MKATKLVVAVLLFAAVVFVAASAPPEKHNHHGHNHYHDHHHHDHDHHHDEHEYVEYTHQSYLSKIGGSMVGASIGFLLFLLPFPCLFWNEGRSVRRDQALSEGASKVVSTDSRQVSPVLDGRLIHLQGTAESKETLTDNECGITVPALRFARKVEVFQWHESSTSETTRNTGGSSDTKTTYTYRKDWSENLVDSKRFKRADEHRNPDAGAVPLKSETWNSKIVSLGSYSLPTQLVEKIDNFEIMKLDPQKPHFLRLPPHLMNRYYVNGDYIYIGGDAANPQVGDIRVSFRLVNNQQVSVLGEQRGNTLAPFKTTSGDNIFVLSRGIQSANELFAAEATSNNVMTWVLRFLGWLFMLIGMLMIGGPILAVLDVLPFLSDIAGSISGFIAFGLASFFSLITIAVAWLFYRPLKALLLVTVAFGVMYISSQLNSKVK